MLTLYYTPGACSMAAHIVLEESGEEYEEKKVGLAGGEQHRGRPPTPASAISKDGPASIRRCNVLGRIIKRQRVIVVYPTFCDVTSMQQSHATSR